MKKKLLAGFLLAGGCLFAAPHIAIGIGVGVGAVPVPAYGYGYYAPAPVYAAPVYAAPAYVPVPAPVVYEGPVPGPGYTWVGGYWYGVGPRRMWRPGYWAAPRGYFRGHGHEHWRR